VLNALITGDTISVERKGKDQFDYQNTAKILWAMKSLPSLYDATNGLFRRAYILEVGQIPENQRDPDVIERVKLEGQGITNWALAGLKRLNERDRFEYPKSVKEATERFRGENDLQEQFLEDQCQRAPSEQLFHTEEYRVCAEQPFHDSDCAGLMVDRFPIEYLTQHFFEILESVEGSWHSTKLDLRVSEMDPSKLEHLAATDEITFAYVSTKLGRSFEFDTALSMFERNKYDERLSLLIWCFGHMKLWSVLKNIVQDLDEEEIARGRFGLPRDDDFTVSASQ
jgi:hypothetical protein